MKDLAKGLAMCGIKPSAALDAIVNKNLKSANDEQDRKEKNKTATWFHLEYDDDEKKRGRDDPTLMHF
jgi:hypothetical protein